MYFRHISIRWQLMWICILLVAVPAVVSGILSHRSSKQAIMTFVEKKLRDQTAMIARQIETAMEITQQKVNADLNVARYILSSYGQPTLDSNDPIAIEAVNQITQEVQSITIPAMKLGEKKITFDEAVVDQIQGLISGTATIFQMFSEGAMRIATNVLQTDGTRAVGTYIPKDSPVYQTVMRGEKFYGRAYVVNTWHQTAYEPIRDAQGQVIGMLYVGVNDASGPILDNLAKLVIGKTGYIWIYNLKGEYVLSQKRQRDGEIVLESQDETGRFFVQDWIKIAPSFQPDETRIDYYPWKNPGENKARLKVAAYTYLPQWEWIIGTSAYVDDFMDSLNTHKQIMIGVSLMAFLVGSVIAYVFALLMVKRFNLLVKRMNHVAMGNLAVAIDASTDRNELGRIWSAFAKMSNDLKNLVANVIATVQEVNAGTDTIFQEVHTLTGQMQQQTTSVDHTTTSVNRINEAIRVIGTDTNELLAAIEEALSAIHETSANINEITKNTGHLTLNVQDISAAIDHVNESVKQISISAEQLVKSADQTETEMQHIDDSFNNVSDNADRFQHLAEETRDAALKGQESVDASIQGMLELKQVVSSSAQIIQEVNSWGEQVSSILNIVDEIAEQTSLLALNASIISAQAGEHGKGFSVVAEEIKDLATRTKDSTKEISSLIRTLQAKTAAGVKSIAEEITKADQGVKLVSAVKESLNSILASATRSSTMATDTARVLQQTADSSQLIRTSIGTIADMISAIRTAIQEQTSNISKIDAAVEQIHGMSEHVNTANVEQNKASAQISKSMEFITQRFGDIAVQTEELKTHSGQIVEAMRTVDSITESILQDTTEMSDNTVKALAHRADVLQEIVSVFKVS